MSTVTLVTRNDSHLVENLERLQDLLLAVGVLHFPGHQSKKLGKVDGPISIRVNLCWRKNISAR